MGTNQILLALTALALPSSAPAENPAPPTSTGKSPLEIVLVDPTAVSARNAAAWPHEGFKAVAVVLEERFEPKLYRQIAEILAARSLDVYYWIEVARNPAMSEAHPKWMASLGMHDDWQKRFPRAPRPKEGEVAKAFPWVPINYQEAFDAHLSRIEQLLKRVPKDYRGLLLNDLQGGPSSCGCGNLQCRWATDYHVPATGALIEGDDVAARFVSAVRQRASGQTVIPVWTTECEEEDLPANKRPDGKTTGYCGTVGCAVGRCPKDFTKQWSALVQDQEGPIGLLTLHREFDRARQEYGQGPAWIAHAVGYLDKVLPQNGVATFPHEKLWLVVQGTTKEEEWAARRAAVQLSAGAVIVGRTKIDASYTPRITSVK